MVKLIQAIENRIYSNAAAARKAKSIMNAIGVMLQELPALLESLDEDKDGCQYVLFDIGKFRMPFSSTLVHIDEGISRCAKPEGEEGHKRDCMRSERGNAWLAKERKPNMSKRGCIHISPGVKPAGARVGLSIIYRTLFQSCPALKVESGIKVESG